MAFTMIKNKVVTNIANWFVFTASYSNTAQFSGAEDSEDRMKHPHQATAILLVPSPGKKKKTYRWQRKEYALNCTF